jgi:Xaa-Pro aminopeptidase
MTTPFDATFFKNNRARLCQLTDAPLIVIAANGLLQRSADTTFPFRQESNFWYLTGIDEPDFTLVIHNQVAFLIAPKRAEHRDLWDGTLDESYLARLSGIDKIYEHHEGWILLDSLIKKLKKVHTLSPAEAYIEAHGFFANPARQTLLTALQRHNKLAVIDIRKIIASQRQVKQPSEITALKAAIALTTGTLAFVKNNLKNFKTEAAVNAEITKQFILAGANGHAYQPIIASGGNASTIHYIKNNQPLDENALILIDVGAEVQNYSADITRTFAIKAPTKRQAAIHKAVKEVHSFALSLLKPGVTLRSFETEVDRAMARQLKSLALINDDNDKKQLKKYYPHLTSHFLGLDTHDVADYDLPLTPGMVLTVEPGIYVAKESIGVRLEDDVLVTPDGVEVLSGHLSLDL